MATKHHNHEYDGGSPDIPLAVGDRYYAQDLGRDFNYLRNLVGKALADLGQTLPALVSGGVVTKGAGDTLNITPAVGYANHEVDLPDAFSSIPPAVIQEDIVLRAESPQQTNMAVPGATLNGSTVNYVKLRYAEVDENSRTRVKKAGTYYYEQSAGFSIVVNPTENTDYDVLLATFTGTIGGAFTITQFYPLLTDFVKGSMIDWGTGADEVDGDLMPLGTELTHAPTGGTPANLTAASLVRAAFQKVLDLLINLSGVQNNAVVNRHIGPSAVRQAEVDFGVDAGDVDADVNPLGTAVTSSPTGGTATNLANTSFVRNALQTIFNRLIDLSGVQNGAVLTRHHAANNVTLPKLAKGTLDAYLKGQGGADSIYEKLALRDTGVKIGNGTRESSGNQVITGVGFQPSAVIFMAVDTNILQTNASWGFDNGSEHMCSSRQGSGGTYGYSTGFSIFIQEDGSNYIRGCISTLSSDGFTITWTYDGTMECSFVYLALP